MTPSDSTSVPDIAPPPEPIQWVDTAAIEAVYHTLAPQCEIVLAEMGRILSEYVEKNVPAVQVKSRVKRLPSLLEKVHRKHGTLDLAQPLPVLRQLTDLMALRAVCPFLEDVDAVAEAAQSVFEVFEIDQKGEGRSFSEFGYSSTHLLVSVPENLQHDFPMLANFRVEIQIRTILQDAWAEVEHELIYKVGAHPLNTLIRRKLASLNATLVLSDTIFQEIRDYQKTNISDLARARQNFLEQASTDRVPVLSPASRPPTAARRVSQAEIEKLLKKGLNAQIAGEMEDAVRIYTDLASLSLDNFTLSVVLNHRGMANEAMNRHRDAATDFSRAREADPRNARARINLALAWRRLGQLEDAERELRETIALKPNSAHAHYGLALVLNDRQDLSGAATACQRALKLSHSFSHAQQLLDEIQERLGLESGNGS